MPFYLFVTNPFSKHGLNERRIGTVVEALTAAGSRVDIVRTRGVSEAETAVSDLKRPYDAIITAGGDGTIGEIINGLAGKTVPIGIIPCGTANVLAGELEIPHRLRRAVDVILQGRVLGLDVGVAGKRRFILMASAGYDAQVVEEVHRARGNRFGYRSYVFPMWRVLKRSRFPEITVELHGQKHTCRHVVVANVQRYGGPFRPAPQAIYNDGEFDVVMYQWGGRWNMIRYGALAMAGSTAPKDDIVRIRADRVTLSSEERVPLQCDGDPAGELPRTIRLRRDAATFLVP